MQLCNLCISFVIRFLWNHSNAMKDHLNTSRSERSVTSGTRYSPNFLPMNGRQNHQKRDTRFRVSLCYSADSTTMFLQKFLKYSMYILFVSFFRESLSFLIFTRRYCFLLHSCRNFAITFLYLFIYAIITILGQFICSHPHSWILRITPHIRIDIITIIKRKIIVLKVMFNF